MGVVFEGLLCSQIKGLLCSVFLKCRDSPKLRAELNSCLADTFNKLKHFCVPKAGAGAVWAAGISAQVLKGEF